MIIYTYYSIKYIDYYKLLKYINYIKKIISYNFKIFANNLYKLDFKYNYIYKKNLQKIMNLLLNFYLNYFFLKKLLLLLTIKLNFLEILI